MPSDHDAPVREPSDVEQDALMRSLWKVGGFIIPPWAARSAIIALDAARRPDPAPAEASQDPRLPGMEHAEGIADHWHQRFLLLRDEHPAEHEINAEIREALNCRAIGAKRVLDEIKAEHARLSLGDGAGERDGGGSDG